MDLRSMEAEDRVGWKRHGGWHSTATGFTAKEKGVDSNPVNHGSPEETSKATEKQQPEN